MAVIKILAFLLVLHASVADENVACPEVVTRNQWGGASATDINYLIVPIPYVVIHHTVTPECNTQSQCASRVESIRSYHMDTLGWHDIGYSFIIGGDGRVYEGCGWTREGAHTYGYNKKAVGIAFIGNFQDKKASENMLNAAHQLILCGKSMDTELARMGINALSFCKSEFGGTSDLSRCF
ncbi:hypothetical protein KM043_013955 [Ampulex compressa]|nr:hypothetical protein KM043_013955 [Ampulex compressa]